MVFISNSSSLSSISYFQIQYNVSIKKYIKEILTTNLLMLCYTFTNKIIHKKKAPLNLSRLKYALA